jgi:hypothetical protein
LWPLFSVVWIFLRRAGGNFLLEDSDTRFLLLKIAERKNPWSWFWTDWPLENHFYRPVSTFAFELDRALYGMHGNGYGLTQALIAMAGVLLATWMLVELTESTPIGCVAGGLFGCWVAGFSLVELGHSLAWWVAAGCLLGIVRGRANLGPAILAALASVFFFSTLEPPYSLYSRIVGWLPGRTASVMALFCFAGVAAYARYLRSADRKRPSLTSEDVPATRGSSAQAPVRASSLWGIAALTCVALALASYEQAVMMPALLTGTAIWFWLKGSRPKWWVPSGSWVVLAGYWVLRRAVVPSGVSRYQGQQLRFGPGVIGSLLDFSVPGLGQSTTIINSFDGFPFSYLVGQPWIAWSLLLGNFCLIFLAWRSRHRWTFVASWLMALFSFMPMAWLKMFEHYYYWPSAFFALAVVTGGLVLVEAVVKAWSPPPLVAPRRDTPAPGALA